MRIKTAITEICQAEDRKATKIQDLKRFYNKLMVLYNLNEGNSKFTSEDDIKLAKGRKEEIKDYLKFIEKKLGKDLADKQISEDALKPFYGFQLSFRYQEIKISIYQKEADKKKNSESSPLGIQIQVYI